MDISKGQIGNALESTASNKVVACANAIYDENYGNSSESKNYQDAINKDHLNRITTLETTGGPKGDTGVRGSRWLSGTAITGTATTNTKFTSSGITDALVNDEYLNTSTGNVYKCTTAGNASTATWVYTGNIKGADGTSGTSATWFTGTAVTGTSTTATSFTVANSKAGDMYLNTSTNNVYSATAANSWKYVCNIKGTDGTKGDDGTRGSKWNSGTTISGGASIVNQIFSNSGITDSLVNDLYLNTTESFVYVCTTKGPANTAKWSYLCSIKGASGKTWYPSVSESGDLSWTANSTSVAPITKNIRGPEGPQGPAGTGVNIKGNLANTSALPTVGTSGDAYLIDGSLYVYVGSGGNVSGHTQWSNVGSIQGPAGKTWLPSVDDSGNLSWTQSNSTTTPTTKNIKGPKGDALKYSDLTQTQKNELKGEKGDSFEYSDFTTEQLEALRGSKWFTGKVIRHSSGSAWASIPNSKIGDMYLTLDTCNIYQCISENTWEYKGNLKGEDGTDGTDGNKWYSGTVVSTNNIICSPDELGFTPIVNDYYLNTSTQEIFRCKRILGTSSTWDYLGVFNDLSNYYTKSEVDTKIANASTGGTVDLSNYYTKSEIDDISEQHLLGVTIEQNEETKKCELRQYRNQGITGTVDSAVIPTVTESADGLMNSDDKKLINSLQDAADLDYGVGILAGAMGVREGRNKVTITYSGIERQNDQYVNEPYEIYISSATSATSGVMSCNDKRKLDAIHQGLYLIEEDVEAILSAINTKTPFRINEDESWDTIKDAQYGNQIQINGNYQNIAHEIHLNVLVNSYDIISVIGTFLYIDGDDHFAGDGSFNVSGQFYYGSTGPCLYLNKI